MAVVLLVLRPSFSPAPLATSALLASAGGWLIVRSRPRSSTVSIDLRTETLHEGKRRLGVGRTLGFRLSGSLAELGESAREDYRVELLLADGRREILLERDDPAAVLTELRQILQVWQLPVQTGWGLPKRATPWLSNPNGARAAAAGLTFTMSGPSRAAQAPAATATGVGGALILLIVGLFMLARSRRGEPFTPLSLALPATGLSALFVLSAALGSARIQVTADGEVIVERRVFGISYGRRVTSRTAIVGAYSVSPGNGVPTHVLVDTSTAPLAFRATPELATAIAEALDPSHR